MEDKHVLELLGEGDEAAFKEVLFLSVCADRVITNDPCGIEAFCDSIINSYNEFFGVAKKEGKIVGYW